MLDLLKSNDSYLLITFFNFATEKIKYLVLEAEIVASCKNENNFFSPPSPQKGSPSL